MPQPIIKSTGLSKQYHIGARERINRTFREALIDVLLSPIRNFRNLRRLTKVENDYSTQETIWALKDVSFEVYQGEVVGIIGRNGAGKSTLLKILSRITEPTSGEILLQGRVSSLLEVGTGFHPELTGRENIYLNGTILGMRKREIDSKFDEIVSFSEIEKFLDTPVKRYSSGMYVRLAFAVAAHLEPEILLMDEVLAVGDTAFQKKCLVKMGNVAKEGRTILFVSHNLASIQNLCHRAIIIDKGNLIFSGKVYDVIDHYLSGFEKNNTFAPKSRERYSNVKIHVEKCEIYPNPPKTGNPIDFNIFLVNTSDRTEGVEVDLSIAIKTEQGVPIFQLYSKHVGIHFHICDKITCITAHLENLPLAPGRYLVNIWIGRGTEAIEFIPDALALNVESGALNKTTYVESSGYPVVMLSEWKQNKADI
jgi:lipopolysaccharide transport system ATP-binding protein